MTPRRYPCRRCRARIDPDLSSCPACEAPDPLAYRRDRRKLASALLAAGAVALLSAWVVLV